MISAAESQFPAEVNSRWSEGKYKTGNCVLALAIRAFGLVVCCSFRVVHLNSKVAEVPSSILGTPHT